jgi:metal-responsive CopG/Arc/MetJ family transcriptional regulator
VLLPREALDEIDSLVGTRRRSAFVSEAVLRELRRRRTLNTIRTVAGKLTADYPSWSSPEAVSEWVRDLRADRPEQYRVRPRMIAE